MSVSINIVNESTGSYTSELQAAKDLRDLLTSSFSYSVKGEIIIVPNATLVGQDPRDVDLLVAGKLEGYVLPQFYTNDSKYKKKDLCLNGFCVAIELKQHVEKDIKMIGSHIYVSYNRKWKDATEQNEKQRYSVVNYFRNDFNYDPWVTNFIWLKSLSTKQLLSLRGGRPIGAMPSNFDFKDFVDMMILQGARVEYDKEGDQMYHIRSSYGGEDFLEDFKSVFSSSRSVPQGLTRRKLDQLLQKKTIAKLNSSSFGTHLMVFSGRAGTGKTFSLIQSALQLANPDTGKRCLLLTYNHALVSDVRRLLHFMNIPDGIDNYTVQIRTLQSFFMNLMEILSIDTSSIIGKNFEKEYKRKIIELRNIVTYLMNEKDIAALKDDNELSIDWDYIFVDEGQDWSDEEREILYFIYGSEHIIVADGKDQFIRAAKKQVWQKNVKNPIIIKGEKGLRQKRNLSEFVNEVACELDLNWEVKPNNIEGWSGGQIFIVDHYRASFHKELEKYNKRADCENYDILFLVPPEMVDKNPRQFKNFEKWEKKGIHLYDGTNENRRQSYPTDVKQCRLFQYDSCRGLEGWITICLHFDELIQYKMKEVESMDLSPLELESQEQTIRRFVYLWSLMPLTRPIDTLVISLKDPNSEIGIVLKKIADKNDFVHWLI